MALPLSDEVGAGMGRPLSSVGATAGPSPALDTRLGVASEQVVTAPSYWRPSDHNMAPASESSHVQIPRVKGKGSSHILHAALEESGWMRMRKISWRMTSCYYPTSKRSKTTKGTNIFMCCLMTASRSHALLSTIRSQSHKTMQ